MNVETERHDGVNGSRSCRCLVQKQWNRKAGVTKPSFIGSLLTLAKNTGALLACWSVLGTSKDLVRPSLQLHGLIPIERLSWHRANKKGRRYGGTECTSSGLDVSRPYGVQVFSFIFV